jgi:hypothetical protein
VHCGRRDFHIVLAAWVSDNVVGTDTVADVRTYVYKGAVFVTPLHTAAF